MTALTDHIRARLGVVHKPTFDYITERRANGVPTRGKPVRKPLHPVYQAARISKEQAAAEYWKSCVDLSFTARANPAYEQTLKEVETWRRFATTDHAF